MNRVSSSLIIVLAGLFTSTTSGQQSSSVPAVPTPEFVPILVPGDDGSYFGAAVVTQDPFVIESARVTANVRGLAYSPSSVEIPILGGDSIRLGTKRIDLLAGVDVDDDGNIIVDPDPNAISLFWWGSDGDNAATVSVDRGQMRGYVSGSRGRFEFARDRNGVDVFRSYDPEKLSAVACLDGGAPDLAPLDGESLAAELTEFDPGMQSQASELPVPALPKYIVEIGVVFLYTPAALNAVSAVGDPSAFGPIADDALNQLNLALDNTYSAAHLRVTRVGPFVPIAYDESPGQPSPGTRWLAHRNFMILNRFNDGSSPDGIDILGSRSDHGGDIVVMFVADEGSSSFPFGPWGVAVTQRQKCVIQFPAQTCEPGALYKDYAFVVQSVNKSSIDFTLSHELGHALGSEHDRAGVAGVDYVDWTTGTSPNAIASFAHSYGYRVGTGGTSGAKGDIMTSPQCFPSNNPSNCWVRLVQFSDPARAFSGSTDPAGQLPPSNPNQGYGHNAQTFRKLAEDVASFFGGTVERPMFWDGFES
jgi:hypothetical protein